MRYNADIATMPTMRYNADNAQRLCPTMPRPLELWAVLLLPCALVRQRPITLRRESERIIYSVFTKDTLARSCHESKRYV